MGLLKITDDIQEAKRCYLENIKKGERCIIRRDYKYKTWIVELYRTENQRSFERIRDEVSGIANKRPKIQKENVIKMMKSTNSKFRGSKKRQSSNSKIGRASSLDVLGFSPGNAPRLYRRIRPFCGTNEEIRNLRRGS